MYTYQPINLFFDCSQRDLKTPFLNHNKFQIKNFTTIKSIQVLILENFQSFFWVNSFKKYVGIKEDSFSLIYLINYKSLFIYIINIFWLIFIQIQFGK